MGRDESGFSLVEVLVAIAILALVTATTLGAMSAAVGWGADGEQLLAARSIAQSKLDNWIRSSDSMADSGEAGPFEWAITEQPLHNFEPIDLTSAELTPHRIHVTVRWVDGGEPQSFALESVRVKTRAGDFR